MPQLTILDHTGDSVVPFDPNDADTLAAAKAKFAELIEGPDGKPTGRRAFAVKPTESGGEITLQANEFDPGAFEIIIISPMVGG